MTRPDNEQAWSGVRLDFERMECWAYLPRRRCMRQPTQHVMYKTPKPPVRRVNTPSNLPVRATEREGRRITGYQIVPKDLLETPTRINPRNYTQLSALTEAIGRLQSPALRSLYRVGVPRKRRRFDTASSPACPLLAAASGQGHHVVTRQQAKKDALLEATADPHG